MRSLREPLIHGFDSCFFVINMSSLLLFSRLSLTSRTHSRTSNTKPSSYVTPRSKRFYATSSNPCLVIADHDNKKVQPGTFNTITAASKLSSNVLVLAAGNFGGKGKSEGVA